VGSDLELRIEWPGEMHLNVEVRRIPRTVEDWTPYGTVGLTPNTNGVYFIDYTLDRLKVIVTAWLDSNFDRMKAERKLVEAQSPPPR